MCLSQEVINRLMLCKSFLLPIKNAIIERPSNFQLAKHVLAAHDAAELAMSAIAEHRKCRPRSDRATLMDYIGEIKKQDSSGAHVPGRDFFSRLNSTRNSLKHRGILPNQDQWRRVGKNVYGHISNCCKQYLNITFDDLDESELIINHKIKSYYHKAQEYYSKGEYKSVLEELAKAGYVLFNEQTTLRGLVVASTKAEDAIKLTAYGVSANDYLQLQEFLPIVHKYADKEGFETSWDQNKYGHPGNWREDSAEFCLKAFLSLVISIQDVEWIPGTVPFDGVYEYEIESLVNDLEIQGHKLGGEPENKCLMLGEKLRINKVSEEKKSPMATLMEAYSGNPLSRTDNEEGKLSLFNIKPYWEGCVNKEDVSVKCVPRKEKWIKDNIGVLPTLVANIPVKYT